MCVCLFCLVSLLFIFISFVVVVFVVCFFFNLVLDRAKRVIGRESKQLINANIKRIISDRSVLLIYLNGHFRNNDH